MAFFKFQIPGFKSPDKAQSPPVESVDVLRRRARHRLIGAAVLVLVAIIGFPLVFDTQPRPVAVDVSIVIPDRNKVAPLALPAPSSTAAGAASSTTPPSSAQSSATATVSQGVAKTTPAAEGSGARDTVNARASLNTREEIVPSKSEKKEAIPSASNTPDATKTRASTTPVAKPATGAATPAADDGSRARALLEGKDAPKAAAAPTSAERFIVQIGAFADAGKARETRLKVEKAGLVTYTQVVETADGKRIRVRVGPYAHRAEADKAAAKIRALDLPAAILTL